MSRLFMGFFWKLLALGLTAWPAGTWAIPASIRLDQLHHQRWTVADGAPVVARAMAQSADGALWLGSSEGLYRFDGVHFQRIPAPTKGGRHFGNVSALMAMPDGSLWIGLRFGGAYLMQGSRFTAHGEAQGLPSERSIFKFALGRDGRVWAATTQGLFMLTGDRWRRFDDEIGHPDLWFHDLAVDRDGTLWASSTEGVWSLAAGAVHMKRVHATKVYGHLAALQDGSVWYAPYDDQNDPKKRNLMVLRPASDQSGHVSVRTTPWIVSPMLGDRDGGLWFSHPRGITRLPHPGALRGDYAGPERPEQGQHFTVDQGLSGREVSYFYEDREGNVWVSTVKGLDRFRVPPLRRFREGHASALRTNHDGSMLACSATEGAWDERGVIKALAAAGRHCDALEVEPSGRTWWALDRRLWWRQGKETGQLPWPPEAQPVLSVASIKVDRAGALWASTIRRGIFRFHQGRWSRFEAESPDLRRLRPLIIGSDGAGHMWFGYSGSHVLQRDGERQRIWGPGQGLEIGNVLSLTAFRGLMLVGGTEGLAMVDPASGRVSAVVGDGNEPFMGVTGIVFDDDSAWIQTTTAIARVELDSISPPAAASRIRLPMERFDEADGLQGLASPEWPWPSATRTGDGRLWFSTSVATFQLDPKDIAARRAPPPIELRALAVDGQDVDISAGTTLPVGTQRIELRYAAIDISLPQRVRYRYQLEGLDTGWQPTTSRSATYTNLAPGEYTFRVAAANGSGPWSEVDASLRIIIPPAFHQTSLFYALCVMGVGFVAWSAYRLRIRQITNRIRLRAEAQAQERVRIARDLHDTLLQSTQGLALSVQALADRTPADHPERTRIERALERFDQTINEGRRKVLQLRDEDDTDLAALLGELVAELDGRGPAAVSIETRGAPRRLAAEVRMEALCIAQEALLNAHRHAQATEIKLVLDYGSTAFLVRVGDDGVGMDAALMDGRQTRPGHFGLSGLRERASAIDSVLEVRAGPDAGTVVELRVPAARAYATS